jgi:acetylornithine deacetylase/succinyl-diaminopimelate desuccinylase-like protein
MQLSKVEDAYRVIDRDFGTYLEEFRRYLRQPGVSSTGEGIRESAELTLEYVRSLRNTTARLVETGGNPVVLGKASTQDPQTKTLLLYCFYDVVPVVPEEWVSPPFKPTVLEAERLGLPAEYGEVLCARGPVDHKGPFLAALLGLRAMQEVGGLPVNVIFVIEGEEEIGSPSLPAFVHAHQEELREADAFWLPRISQESVGGPMIVHRGYKGQFRLQLAVRGGEWGGTLDGRDIWAANVAWVDAPLWRMVRALNTLVDENDRITIDGFWDHVRPMGPREEAEIADLQAAFDEEKTKRGLKIARFKGGRSGKDLLPRYVFEPQLNLGLGVFPGMPGEESYTKGVIDETARTELIMRGRARLDFRLTPDLEPDLVVSLLRAHLDRRGFREIEIQRTTIGYSWSRSEPISGVYRALFRACKARGIRPLVWPTMSSCAPFDLFNRHPLQLPMIIFGGGHGAWFHEANEYVCVEGIREFMKLMVTWLYAWSEEAAP